ncbi:hypothetical protein Tco_0047804 [Tanacetum coccineum]
MEEDYAPAVQHQRRVNPKIHDVIKKEVEKLLEAGLIYPISDSPWVSPIHCVPMKGGNDCDVGKFFMDDFSVLGILSKNASPFRPNASTISKKGIEVDKAKIDVIAKLPHPTTVKGIRSFLGHAGFYRRFIQDFSKNYPEPIDPILEKSTPFSFPMDWHAKLSKQLSFLFMKKSIVPHGSIRPCISLQKTDARRGLLRLGSPPPKSCDFKVIVLREGDEKLAARSSVPD